MTDWYVGQKIVCIDAKVLPAHQHWQGAQFIIKHLKVGKIYLIEKIDFVEYDDKAKGIGFLLSGIDTLYSTINMPEKDKFGMDRYHFWHGRFKPLEEEEAIEKLDISVFLGLLGDVNDGKVKFDDEDGGLKAPERILEPANE
jgi:hypothetical protein